MTTLGTIFLMLASDASAWGLLVWWLSRSGR
jgi:hypothetical protein